jgi:hypothetical protein
MGSENSQTSQTRTRHLAPDPPLLTGPLRTTELRWVLECAPLPGLLVSAAAKRPQRPRQRTELRQPALLSEPSHHAERSPRLAKVGWCLPDIP